VGRARGRGARRSRGGMAGIFGPDGGAVDAASQITREHQAGDLREEVGRGTELGWRPDLQDEVQNAEESRRCCWKHQEAHLKVLPRKIALASGTTCTGLRSGSPPSAGGARAQRRRENTPQGVSELRSGRDGRRSCGRRCGRRPRGGRAGG